MHGVIFLVITKRTVKDLVTTKLSGILCVCMLSGFSRLFATLWTVACQAPLSMGCPRQAYWSGLPFPSPGDLPRPGIKPESPALQANSLLTEPPGKGDI